MAEEPGTAAGRRAEAMVGETVLHRRYVAHSHAHYGGNLVDGAYVLGLFGDLATELSIRTDGDEGLFAAYDDVQFLGPLLAGDVVETVVTLTGVGRRSRAVSFTAHVVCRARPDRSASAAQVLAEPLLITRASGTIVAPGADRAP